MTRDLVPSPSARFVVTGLAAAVLQFALTTAFIEAGAHAGFASGCAYALAILAAYLAHRAWTFGHLQLSVRRSAPRYVAVQMLSAVTAMLTASATAVIGFPSVAVAITSTIASSALSFVLSSRWAFRPADEMAPQEISTKVS